MKHITLRVLLIIMILLSFFSGITINGVSGAIYTYEFISLPQMLSHQLSYLQLFLWIVIIIAHIGIVLLPFLVEKSFFKKMLLICPATFLAAYVILIVPYFILLMPFLIFWLISLQIAKKNLQ